MFEVFFDDVLNSWVMAKSICRMCGSYTEFDSFESEEEALNAASEKTKLGERVDVIICEECFMENMY
ncbi:hypothetical protein CAY60_021265 [Shouchella clausii]|uniref:hypothetical protein n=1 Tax=Shouchella TaxID=2893057 RepID=UPI0004E62A88|nr:MULTISPECIES: hypothetical protein [Shouchella]ALA55222.1 hypothetical protein DB29_0P0010 [Shouchella clausii]MBU3266285.1 hypothetical protein [Shouchella clausii]MBU3509378.1 hypothetical protein [Shouchella clausii]MDP0461983.1 hypothetical protein [Shouchella rhizosphaerae]MDP5267778.1 hypothetical protein [Shouchella clausii]